MVHTCDPKTQEAEAGLHVLFQDSQNYIERLCLEKINKNVKKMEGV